MPTHDELYRYVNQSDGSLSRGAIVADGRKYGEGSASSDYPYAVYREEQGAQAVAELSFQQWIRDLKSKNIREEKFIKIWDANASEGKRLYVSSFAGAYLDKVREQDKKAGITSIPSSVQGATLTLKQVERNANEYVYYIELADPGHIDGVQTAEVVYPLGEVEPAQAFSSAGFAVSASDSTPSYKAIVPLPASQQTKGSRLYVRNVKKK